MMTDMSNELYVIDADGVERRVCCPKCGAGNDRIRVQERRTLHGSLTPYVYKGNHPALRKNLLIVEFHDAESGQTWTMCEECGYRSKSQHLSVWSEVSKRD